MASKDGQDRVEEAQVAISGIRNYLHRVLDEAQEGILKGMRQGHKDSNCEEDKTTLPKETDHHETKAT